MTLDKAIEKIERWRDTLDANATHYERQGLEQDARRCHARSADLCSVLEILREVECYPLTTR